MPYTPAANSMKKEKKTAGVKGASESNMTTNDIVIKNEIVILLNTYFPCKI